MCERRLTTTPLRYDEANLDSAVQKELKEAIETEGSSAAATSSPRGIIKEAYTVYPFFDGELWLDMLKDRNDIGKGKRLNYER